MNNDTYYSTLPASVRTKLEAGAFASLCAHLQDRSDAVQNIDLMTLSGFCRNCLAKWLVVEARKLSAELKADANNTSTSNDENSRLIQALDAMGYDETAEHVYGCAYAAWKKRHAKKATDEQMDKYNDSKPLHAAHDKELLAVKAEKPANAPAGGGGEAVVAAASPASDNKAKNPLLSDVCCEDVDGAGASAAICRPTSSAAKPA